MSFNGFQQTDFDTFAIDGLELRMAAIRERIQPKFKAIGEALCDDVSLLAGNEMFVHIAKHARRKINPPKDTWMAFCHNKRGYKQHPHFQVGLFDDHVFIWFALIYELPHKQAIADHFLAQIKKVTRTIPSNYVLSFDHMKKDAIPFGQLKKSEWIACLTKFRNVKKAELLIGRHFKANDLILHDGHRFIHCVRETFETLMPLYRLAMI